jgi:hypothetical protein
MMQNYFPKIIDKEILEKLEFYKINSKKLQEKVNEGDTDSSAIAYRIL